MSKGFSIARARRVWNRNVQRIVWKWRGRAARRSKLVLGLGVDHPACARAPECGDVATSLYEEVSGGGYEWPMSVLQLSDFEDFIRSHRTARKRAAHSRKLGYRFSKVSRAEHLDEVYAVNISAPERQGRPMTAAYQEKPQLESLPDYTCARHRVDEYGVFTADGVLVAYLVLKISGDAAWVKQILGHADHLRGDIMYLLATDAFQATLESSGPMTFVYNRHDSNTEGLQFFKERLGFAPMWIQWSTGVGLGLQSTG